MDEPKPFASLSPTLLARKGGARPAMRPQLQPLHLFHEATARQMDEDLGWNDMGFGEAEEFAIEPVDEEYWGDVVAFSGSKHARARLPDVVRRQRKLASDIATPDAPRRSALSEGRRAAFTLRLDAERHLKLRLACTIENRSAQQIVTEALDRLIAELPDVAELASRVGKRR
jgi:hypothetical protein